MNKIPLGGSVVVNGTVLDACTPGWFDNPSDEPI